MEGKLMEGGLAGDVNFFDNFLHYQLDLSFGDDQRHKKRIRRFGPVDQSIHESK